METLNIIKDLVEKMSIDTRKVLNTGNTSAAIRSRKNAQLLKTLIPKYRKEILDKIKNNKRHNKNYGVKKPKRNE